VGVKHPWTDRDKSKFNAKKISSPPPPAETRREQLQETTIRTVPPIHKYGQSVLSDMMGHCIIFVFIICIVFGTTSADLAFASKNIFPSFPNPFAPRTDEDMERTELRGEALLQSLDLRASREPKVLYTDPNRSWDIATATAPVSFQIV